MVLFIMLFNKQIINTLSTESYSSTPLVIIILLAGSLVKPVGRVFGLLLDAMGRPKVNFQMLSFSLAVNLIMNLALIPSYGAIGAAIATSSSIVLTIIAGQLLLRRWLKLDWSDMTTFARVFKQKLSLT